MDLAESIAPDSSVEFVGEINNATHPYDEFMIESDSSANESHESLTNIINDNAADSIP